MQRDIDRIGQIWHSMRRQYGADGPFLFGDFSIVDAMYAPVVLRYRSYGVRVSSIEQAYCDAILALPAIQMWLSDAAVEQEALSKYEKAL